MIEYISNNSGGDWWLSDDDWRALEAVGWRVEWKPELGALATSATRRGLSMTEAVAEWERVTGKNAAAEGCSHCGPPHRFYEVSDE